MEQHGEAVDRAPGTLKDFSTDPRVRLDEGELRSRDRRRHIRRRNAVLGVVLAIVVLLAVVIPFGLQGSTKLNAHDHIAMRIGTAVQLVSDAHENGSATRGTLSKAVAQSEQQFSLSLLNKLSRNASPMSNIVISPFSLASALSMLELGARGATKSQIAHVLSTDKLTAQQQAAGWSALSAELEASATTNGASLRSANSLWLQQGFAMDPSFMSSLSRYFASGVWQVNFASDPQAAIDALNTWVARETHGHITSLFTPGAITTQTALVLANAVYFKAAWQKAFLGRNTVNSFHLINGTSSSVPFMNTLAGDPLKVPAYVGPNVDAIELPNRGGQIAALVIMPTSGPITKFTTSLTSVRFDELISELTPAKVQLAMPTFALDSSQSLVSTLKDLGMQNAFTNNADFSAMSPTAVHVGAVVQSDTLHVNRWGTEASAATGIAVALSNRPASVRLTINHPFLFLIRDVQTGTILFEAEVANP